MKVATGVKRLDDHLGGGLDQGSRVLAIGPPFGGKETLAAIFALTGLREGVPAVVVLTNETVEDASRRLAAIEPEFPKFESSGLVRYVDAFSRSIEAGEGAANTEFVDGPLDLNGLALAVNKATRKALAQNASHRLLVDSVSTLVAYATAPTTFRFLQVLLGKSRRAGGTSLLLLEAGMHPDPDVQSLKHVVDGAIEMRTEGTRRELRVEGLGTTGVGAWAGYHFTDREFGLSGGFDSGRIR